jgi:hypothetical protein
VYRLDRLFLLQKQAPPAFERIQESNPEMHREKDTEHCFDYVHASRGRFARPDEAHWQQFQPSLLPSVRCEQ